LPLKFKGTRDYLHGSDFFNALTAIGEELTCHAGCFIDRLVFRRYARNLCEITANKPDDVDKLIGQVRYMYSASESGFDYFLVETNQPISERYPYDESLIEKMIDLNRELRSAVLSEPSGYTTIEDVIVLTKYLNYAISPVIEGKWLFGQLTLDESLPDSYVSLEIQMRNLFEARFSVSNIFVDGLKIGTIKFIVGIV